MPTPLNQSLADSALLTKSLPLGLLRAFVQTNAADDGLTPQLLAELKILARTPGLLVACNYGGTLCAAEGISTETLPLGSAAIALRALAALPNTHAAVISGRSLRDLAAVSRLPAEVHLVGSHGAEFDMGYAHGLSLATESVLQQASQALAETVGAYRGITIERKPVAVSVHTRPAAPDVVALATEQAEVIARAHGLSFIVDGSVLDLSVVEPAKATALVLPERRKSKGLKRLPGSGSGAAFLSSRTAGPVFFWLLSSSSPGLQALSFPGTMNWTSGSTRNCSKRRAKAIPSRRWRLLNSSKPLIPVYW